MRVQPIGLFSEYAGLCDRPEEALRVGEYGYDAWHNPWTFRPFQCPDILRRFRASFPEVLVTLNVPFIRIGSYGITQSHAAMKFHADWRDLVFRKNWILRDKVSGTPVKDPGESAEEGTYDFRIAEFAGAYSEYLLALLTPFLEADMGHGGYLDEMHDDPPWWEAPSKQLAGVQNNAVSSLLWRQGIARVLNVLRDRLPLGTVLRANGTNMQRVDGQTAEHWKPADPFVGFGAPYGLAAVAQKYPSGLNAVHFHWNHPRARTGPISLDRDFRRDLASTLALGLLYDHNVVVCPDGRFADIRRTIWDLRPVVPEWFSKPLGHPTSVPVEQDSRIIRTFVNGEVTYNKAVGGSGTIDWNDGGHLP